MKLTVENLGRIRHAELDIKPLTVLIGPNNTNKTWTAYALYALAQPLSSHLFDPFFGQDSPVEFDINLREKVSHASSQVLAPIGEDEWSGEILGSFGLEEFVPEPGAPYLLKLGPTTLGSLLALTPEHFAKAKAQLQVSRADFADNLTKSIHLTVESRRLSAQVREHGKVTGKTMTEWINDSPKEAARKQIEKVLRIFALRKFAGVVPFPAERKALAAFYDRLEGNLRNLASLPIIMFTKMMALAQTFATHGMPTSASIQLRQLAESFLEGHVLNGRIDFTSVEGGIGLRYIVGNSVPLDMQSISSLVMQATSSLVRAFAGMDVYLKYFASENDLIIIDEPEMNAHPEAQLKIMEFLGVLVNTGIHVVLTTHSPYIADHLNNMIEAAKLPPEKQSEMKEQFTLQTEKAFVDPDRVAVYHFQENGEVKDVLDRERRVIELATFSNVTDRLNSLYSAILRTGTQE